MLSFRRRRLCPFLSLINMVYIHIPFCIRKCLYCDFYSITNAFLYKKYTDAVIEEIRQHKNMKAETVYIGGGTPTVIGENLKEIVKAVTDNFILSENYEFTVETNPATSDEDLLKELRNMGVNRISLGAQSFNDGELKSLGRIHSRNEIFSTVNAIRKAGFDNLSLDIMFGIPNQTIKSLSDSIDCALSLSPEHISAYSLIIEENTPFYSMNLNLPNEDTEREMYYLINDRLEEEGIYRYEISNFAKKGFESRHNTHYWQDYEYIGIGAAAHSYYNKRRYNNVCDVEKYIISPNSKENITLISDEERKRELFMLGLRMKEGIIYNNEFYDKVKPLIDKNLLETEGNRLRLTKRGTDLANLVFMEFIDD